MLFYYFKVSWIVFFLGGNEAKSMWPSNDEKPPTRCAGWCCRLRPTKITRLSHRYTEVCHATCTMPFGRKNLPTGARCSTNAIAGHMGGRWRFDPGPVALPSLAMGFALQNSRVHLCRCTWGKAVGTNAKMLCVAASRISRFQATWRKRIEFIHKLQQLPLVWPRV